MEIYGNYQFVDMIEHRGRHIAILSADKGALHCDLQHEYDKIVCDGCQKPIVPEEVLLIRIDGVEFDFPFPAEDPDAVQEAMEFAMSYIDDVDGPDEVFDDEDTDEVNASPFENGPSGPGKTDLIRTMKKLQWAGRALQIIREVGKG